MVTPEVIRYDVVYRGVLDWHVHVEGVDDPAAFATRGACIIAANVRAKARHTDTGATTEVWAPGPGAVPELQIRYIKPEAFSELLLTAKPNFELIGASYAYGPLFTRLGN